MSVKGIRRMLVGEDMPDKNDPKYKKRYEKEVAAGRKFAKTARIDRAAAKVQGFANAHKTLFLVIVFGFVATCFGINIYRMVRYYGHRTEAASVGMRHSPFTRGKNWNGWSGFCTESFSTDSVPVCSYSGHTVWNGRNFLHGNGTC